MRLPIIPIIVAAVLLGVFAYIFTATVPVNRVLDVPALSRLADIDGIETEIAAAPGGDRFAAIVSGDLWLLGTSQDSKQRLTETPEAESYPSWTPDGKRITFTRGADTFVYNPDTKVEAAFISNATALSWSPTGRIAFVRDRALYLAEPTGRNEQQIIEADVNPDVTIGIARFSPDSLHLAFIKSTLNLRGEVWTYDVSTKTPRQLISDRQVENPLDLGWIMEGRHLIYLTNRAGAYSLWHVNFADSTLLPLTQPLTAIPLRRIGIAVWQDRIILPRHIVDSNVVLSDGTPVAQSENIEFEPAVSPDGKLVAYTLQKANDFEIWTAGIDGSNATFRTLGREPRFGANGLDIYYTHTDLLKGNQDILKIDIRNSDTEHVTDADEIDIAADPSPDGRSVAFSSARGGPVSVWTTLTSGGKRLRLNSGGYGPRYGQDGKSIVFWNMNAFWTMRSDGSGLQMAYEGVPEPTVGMWTKDGLAFVHDGVLRSAAGTLFSIPDRPLWPRFDRLPDGRWVVAPIQVADSSFWAVDLVWKEN